MEDPTQLTEKGSLKGRDDVSFDSGTLMCVNELYYIFELFSKILSAFLFNSGHKS